MCQRKILMMQKKRQERRSRIFTIYEVKRHNGQLVLSTNPDKWNTQMTIFKEKRSSLSKPNIIENFFISIIRKKGMKMSFSKKKKFFPIRASGCGPSKNLASARGCNQSDLFCNVEGEKNVNIFRAWQKKNFDIRIIFNRSHIKTKYISISYHDRPRWTEHSKKNNVGQRVWKWVATR